MLTTPRAAALRTIPNISQTQAEQFSRGISHVPMIVRYDRGSSMFILTEPEERQLFLNAAILGYPMTVPDPSANHISSEVPRVGGEKAADTSIRHPGTVRGTGPAERSRPLLTP